MGVKIKDIPICERPRERLIENGVENLSNDELLAIILKTGVKGSSSKELANLILSKVESIKKLNDILRHKQQIAGKHTEIYAIVTKQRLDASLVIHILARDNHAVNTQALSTLAHIGILLVCDHQRNLRHVATLKILDNPLGIGAVARGKNHNLAHDL